MTLSIKTSLFLPLTVMFYVGLLVSCSGETVVVCPDGRYFTNGLCCPAGTVGGDNACETIGPDVRFVPNDNAPKQDQRVSIPDNASSPDQPGGDGQATDTAPPTDSGQDVQQLSGAVGAPCSIDAQCLEDGVCLSWNQGYCTIPGCQGAQICPEGSTCAAVGQTGACLDLCNEDDPCRTQDSQFCKNVFDTTGALGSMCFGTDAAANGLGGTCASHEECSEELACYQGVPGGICLVNGCTPESCGEQGSCISIDGVPRCLKNCGSDTDCGTDSLQRACIEKENIIGDETNVCFVPSGSEPIGAACTGGFLCDSNFCEITATGVCSVDQNTPCDEIADCPTGQTCNIAPTFTQGFCSKECDFTSTSNCVLSHCAAKPSGSGLCAATCTGPGDTNCLASAGLTCLYGLPLGAAAEKYLCVPPWGPGPASLCESDENCEQGSCAQSNGATGYCMVDCAWDGTCPFPGICVQDESGLQSKCYRSCNTAEDCPGQMQCGFPPTGSRRACIP